MVSLSNHPVPILRPAQDERILFLSPLMVSRSNHPLGLSATGAMCYDRCILMRLVSFDLLPLPANAYRPFRLSVIVIVLLVLLVTGAFGLAPVAANGRATLVSSQEQGPYLVEVSILPGRAVVNNTHLSVRVLSLSSNEVLTEATVSVTATGPETAADIGPLAADNNVLPEFFETTLPFNAPGDWQVSISVDAALGEATVQVPMNVRAGGQINLILVAAGAVAVLALGIWTYDRIRGRRRRR